MQRKTSAEQQGKNGYWFILPFFVFFLVFQVYPIFYSLYLSFTSFDGFKNPKWIGFANYERLFSKDLWGDSARFLMAYINTWRIWLPNIVSQLGLAFLTAVILTNVRLRIKGVGVFRAVFYFPNLVTAASIAILFALLMDWQYGAVNQLIFGANKAAYINWTGSSGTLFQLLISGIQTWMWFGNTMIIIMAGLTSIPQALLEAAWVDGASTSKTFFKVTLPLLRPIMVYIVITSLIGGMQIFDIPFVITTPPGSAGPEYSMLTAMIYTYDQAFTNNQYGYAAALSYIQFLLIAIFSALYFRSMRRQEQGVA